MNEVSQQFRGSAAGYCSYKTTWSVPKLKLLDLNGTGIYSESFTFSSIPFVHYRFNITKDDDGEDGDLQFLFEILFHDMDMSVKGAAVVECGSLSSIVKKIFTVDDNRAFINLVSNGFLSGTDERFENDGTGILDITVSGKVRLQSLLLKFEPIGLDEVFWRKVEDDVVLIVDDKHLPAQSFILRANSPTFSAMLNGNYIENESKTILIKDFDFQTVEKSISILYGHDWFFEDGGDCKEVLQILRFADKYLITWLKDMLESYCLHRVNKSNVCHILQNVHQICPKLAEFCIAYIVANNDGAKLPDAEELDPEIAKEVWLRSLEEPLETMEFSIE